MPQVTPTLVVEFLTFLAEVAVACVIYYEVEHDRQNRFFARSQDAEARKARRMLYAAFFEANPGLKSESMDEARENLLRLIEQKDQLRTACANLTIFENELGFTATRLFARKNVYLELFPQGPVFVWLTIGKHVLSRRRDSGPWYAQHMLRFTFQCLERVLREKRPMVLRSPEGSREFELTLNHLAALKDEIRLCLK